MKIGELARRAGVAPSTIRYYERIGLLPEAPRLGGQRRYECHALDRLAVIEVGQRAGFTLDELAVLLRGMMDRSLSQAWRSLAHRKIEEMDELIAQMGAMRDLLLEGLHCGCLSLEDCALITRVKEELGQRGSKGGRGMLRRTGKRAANPLATEG